MESEEGFAVSGEEVPLLADEVALAFEEWKTVIPQDVGVAAAPDAVGSDAQCGGLGPTEGAIQAQWWWAGEHDSMLLGLWERLLWRWSGEHGTVLLDLWKRLMWRWS